MNYKQFLHFYTKKNNQFTNIIVLGVLIINFKYTVQNLRPPGMCLRRREGALKYSTRRTRAYTLKLHHWLSAVTLLIIVGKLKRGAGVNVLYLLRWSIPDFFRQVVKVSSIKYSFPKHMGLCIIITITENISNSVGVNLSASSVRVYT